MVVRRVAGDTGEPCWQAHARCMGVAVREMPMRGREIVSVVGVSLHPTRDQYPTPLVTLKPVGYVTFCTFRFTLFKEFGLH